MTWFVVPGLGAILNSSTWPLVPWALFLPVIAEKEGCFALSFQALSAHPFAIVDAEESDGEEPEAFPEICGARTGQTGGADVSFVV